MTDTLTPRQQQVADLVAAGLTDRAIADRLGISSATVGHHIEAIALRLCLDSDKNIRVQIVRHVLLRVA